MKNPTLTKEIEHCKQIIERILDENLNYQEPNLTESAKHLIKGKGKKIR